jgi:hypothetical protein
MDEFDAETFVHDVNLAIAHSPQRCDRPPNISGHTVTRIYDGSGKPTQSALVWIVAGGRAYRFTYRLVSFGQEQALSLDYLAGVDATVGTGLSTIGLYDVPGNVMDRAFTVAAYTLGLPSGFSSDLLS